MALHFSDLRAATFDPFHANLAGVRVASLDRALLLLFALAVVASLQSVRLLMSVALLVTRVSTVPMLTGSLPLMMLASSALGIAGGPVGLIASYHRPRRPAQRLRWSSVSFSSSPQWCATSSWPRNLLIRSDPGICALGETRTPHRLIRSHHRTTIRCSPEVAPSLLWRPGAVRLLGGRCDLSDHYCPLESLDN